MSPRLLVLTTQTTHHAYFVRSLLEASVDVSVVVETQRPHCFVPPDHPLGKRDQFEANRWFGGREPRISDLCETSEFESVNAGVAVRHLRDAQADACVVFGTGWIREGALQALPSNRWNLHGGDPRRYRGLDSHLWAAYHKDASGFVTALHVLDPRLDTGAIISATSLDIILAPELYMLRSINTEAAALLVAGALLQLRALNWIPRLDQWSEGRYYSQMPEALLPTSVNRYRELAMGDHAQW